MIFTSKGMVNVKQFLNSNVTAKKYYKVQSFELLKNLPLKCSDIEVSDSLLQRQGTDPSEKFSGKELIETRNVLVVEDDFI